jgi:hypothetical protein
MVLMHVFSNIFLPVYNPSLPILPFSEILTLFLCWSQYCTEIFLYKFRKYSVLFKDVITTRLTVQVKLKYENKNHKWEWTSRATSSWKDNVKWLVIRIKRNFSFEVCYVEKEQYEKDNQTEQLCIAYTRTQAVL